MPAAGAFSHVAWIRGINVGGNSIVKMAALREHLDAAGLGPVQTYIQSGNVLVRAPSMDDAAVADAVAGVLAEHFAVTTPVVAIGVDALAKVVEDAPAGFGTDYDTYRDDVVFLHPALSVADAMAAVRTREGVDEAWAGSRAIYFRRLAAQAGKSYLSRIMGTPEYKLMTIRNWKTATTLRALASA